MFYLFPRLARSLPKKTALARAIFYLQSEGEAVGHDDFGRLVLNGVIHTERELVAYADDLRSAEGKVAFAA